MPLLDLQRRGQQVGRIRVGVQVKTDKGKMRPDKLETFRFTTQSKVAADAVAELFGGTVRDWNSEYEVITTKSAIGVTVPPRDQVVSQWYEMWSKGGCQRRCDSVTEQISGQPCLCPKAASTDNPAEAEAEAEKAAIERSRLASLNPPQACKRVTRISVMIPDLPSLGVWRLDTGSYYAASEIGDAADIMQMARDRGIFLPAMLRIEQRTRVANGQTKKYPVPVLEITATFRQIASGQLEAAGITAQLPPAPGEQPKAITAGTKDLPGTEDDTRSQPAKDRTTGETKSRQGPGLPGATALRGAQPPQAGEGQPPAGEPWERAQVIYERALAAETEAALKACADDARAQGLEEECVCIDRANDTWETLLPLLQELWREKKSNAGAA